MLIGLLCVTVLMSLPAVSGGQTDSPREESRPGTAAALESITIVVVDRATGKPVTKFSYVFGYAVAGRVSLRLPRHDDKTDWQPVESRSGTFVVQAPPACLLFVGVRSRDIKAGSPQIHSFVIRSTDKKRRETVELERGTTVHGTVRDAATRKPIAGATITPRIIYGMDYYPGLEDRQGTSDKDGRYQLEGVALEFGVSAYHPDYGGDGYSVDVEKGEGLRFDVDLKPLEHDTLRGTVRDAKGQPVEGVTVSAHGLPSLQTTRDGSFVFHRLLRRPGWPGVPAVTYSKEGYVTRQTFGDDGGKDGLVVVLQRQVPLTGRVLGPDGQPVKSFAIAAGPGDALAEYRSLKSVLRVVNDPEGRFRLWLDREGKTWVGVRAEGNASREVLTDIPRSGGSLVVRLESGVSVTGRLLVPPGGLARLAARLVPRRNPDFHRGFGSHGELPDWLALTTTVAADGTLHFDHVRPDRYTLRLDGPGVTPKLLAIDIPAGGLDLGSIRLAGRGRIRGRVFEKEERAGGRPFAAGRVLWFDPQQGKKEETFLSNEDGRFSVEDVPIGLALVGFPYGGHVVYSEDWRVQVCENQTTDVRLFDPVASRPLPVEIRVGDGSRAQNESGRGLGARREEGDLPNWPPPFQVHLFPRSRQPLSYVDSGAFSNGIAVNAGDQVVLPDVSPGTYHLSVTDAFSGSPLPGGALFERDITVPTEPLPLKVSLGGGSIKGRVLGAGDRASWVEVIAVRRGGQGPSRSTQCDFDGSYCVRYLGPGTYRLFAHSSRGGWCRVENIAVATNVADAGDCPLARGGTIRGSISFRRPCPVPDEVIATGPPQVSLEPLRLKSGSAEFELAGLWPGRWTITVRGGEETLATATAEVLGTEEVRIELAAETQKRP